MSMTLEEKIRVTERNAALGLQGDGDLDALQVKGRMVKGITVPALPETMPEPRPVTNMPNMAPEMAMMGAVESDPESDGARMREINALGEHPMAGWVPLPDLIGYMDREYSADQLRNDLEAVLTLCGTHKDRAEVRKYRS